MTGGGKLESESRHGIPYCAKARSCHSHIHSLQVSTVKVVVPEGIKPTPEKRRRRGNESNSEREHKREHISYTSVWNACTV